MAIVWKTRDDELVCELCAPLNGDPEGTTWHADLPPGKNNDGRIGPPPRHEHCRCKPVEETSEEWAAAIAEPD